MRKPRKESKQQYDLLSWLVALCGPFIGTAQVFDVHSAASNGEKEEPKLFSFRRKQYNRDVADTLYRPAGKHERLVVLFFTAPNFTLCDEQCQTVEGLLLITVALQDDARIIQRIATKWSPLAKNFLKNVSDGNDCCNFW